MATYKDHLSAPSDLVTTREATSSGFIKMALERSHRASRYVAEARALKASTYLLESVSDLLKEKSLGPALLTASGVSEKASKFFSEFDREFAISEFARIFLEPKAGDFSQELVYRYLLTKGDTLGGEMRNVVGYIAEVYFMADIIAALNIRGIPFKWLKRDSKEWQTSKPNDIDIEWQVCSLSWSSNEEPRLLLTNSKIPQVGKNVDLILLRATPEDLNIQSRKTTLLDNTRYIAFGELKGGIDPAGADEHWKTARSAFERIRTSFHEPTLFFIGAAIAHSMSEEIWLYLKSGQLSNAANLTNETQLASLTSWLVNL